MPSRPTPHHDGSPLHVSTQAPALGEIVRVRLRVPESFGPLRGSARGRTRTASRGSTRRSVVASRRRLAVVGGGRRGREPRARLPLAARRRRRPAALAEPARALARRDARPRRLPARRARARARVGGVERDVPGVPRPVRAVGWRRLRPSPRGRAARLGDPRRLDRPGRPRAAGPLGSSSTGATSTACASTSTTSSGSASTCST